LVFIDHLAADRGQDAKGHPMVNGADIGAQTGAGQPADHRHENLKSAKGQTQTHRQAQARAPAGNAAACNATAQRDGKGIHRQTNSDEQTADDIHCEATLQVRFNKRPALVTPVAAGIL
jgi:hypothetical protein